MRSLIILGSTGSIGRQCCDILREFPGRFRVAGIAAGSSIEALAADAIEFDVPCVALADASREAELRALLPAGIELLTGPDAAERLCAEADYDVALNGIVGAAGLPPSVVVLEQGRTLALANKESLVLAGKLLMDLAETHGADLLPVDSEHNALLQCLGADRVDDVRHVYLTASGGALRDLSLDELAQVTPEQALAHPNWDMGPRITIGSATLMNKALEVIEAAHLWHLGADRIKVLVHRQSIVHGMVEFVDGSMLAELGPPDMRLPIHHALSWPERQPTNLPGFDPVLFANLTFEEPDLERFPALALGYRCVREGGNAGAVLNAADEIAVAAFLAGELPFDRIVPLVTAVLDRRREWPESSIEDLLAADAAARIATAELVAAAQAAKS